MVKKQLDRAAKSLPVRLVLLLASVMVVLLSIATWTGSAAQDLNKAAVVVRFSESTSTSSCVAFEDETITGLELLDKTGLTVGKKVEGMGSLVCKIEDTGCPPDDCFCQCSGGGDCIYWSYWSKDEGGWKYAALGASQVQIADGDINGWSWGPGSLTEAISPPEMSFDEICTEDPGIAASESPISQADAIEGDNTVLEDQVPSAAQDSDPNPLGYLVFVAMIAGLGLLLVMARWRKST